MSQLSIAHLACEVVTCISVCLEVPISLQAILCSRSRSHCLCSLSSSDELIEELNIINSTINSSCSSTTKTDTEDIIIPPSIVSKAIWINTIALMTIVLPVMSLSSLTIDINHRLGCSTITLHS